MTWDGLKEKAKKMGYVEQQDLYRKEGLGKNGIVFDSNGTITDYIGQYIKTVARDRTPAKMLAIMKALQ